MQRQAFSASEGGSLPWACNSARVTSLSDAASVMPELDGSIYHMVTEEEIKILGRVKT